MATNWKKSHKLMKKIMRLFLDKNLPREVILIGFNMRVRMKTIVAPSKAIVAEVVLSILGLFMMRKII